MKKTGQPLSKLAGGMSKYPQKMLNVRTSKRLDPATSAAIQDAIRQAEGELRETGRVVLRASGTEPVIRVMVEGRDEHQVLRLAERLAAVVAQAAA
jgi:phosphoglucosamine mutase